MENLKEWALIARDLGFPMVVTLYLLWLNHSKVKELYDKMHHFALLLQETCMEIKGLRSDVRELYRSILYARAAQMYEGFPWHRDSSYSDSPTAPKSGAEADRPEPQHRPTL